MVVTVSLKGQEYWQAALGVGVVKLLPMGQADFKGKSPH